MNAHTPPKRNWLAITFALALPFLLVMVAVVTTGTARAEAGLISGLVTGPEGELPPAGTVVLLLSPDGSSHGQAQVDAGSGAFTLGPVPVGNYLLQARPPLESPLTPSTPLPVVMLGSSLDVGTLALTNPSILGTVFAPDGVTPVTARVRIIHQEQWVGSPLATNGVIAIGGLYTGTYTLRAEPVTNDPWWLSAPQSITFTVGPTQTVDLALTPANVAGIVTDPNGIPVPGATVHVLGRFHHLYRRDVSNEDGYFAIGDLIPDSYNLVAEPPWQANGLAISEILSFTVPPDFTDMGLVALRAAPKTLSGVVTASSGQPVFNARVVANRLDHAGHHETLTAVDGSYELNLSGGLWSITLEQTDAGDPPDWVNPLPPQLIFFAYNFEAEAKSLNFTVLVPDAHVTGSVEMPDGSTPPFTVTVSLFNNEGLGHDQVIPPNVGTFDVSLPHGNYVLRFEPQDPGYAGPAPQEIYVGQNETLPLEAATLVAKDAVISGVVRDEEGSGVGNVAVLAWTRDRMGARALTNPDGTYALAVAPGDWLVQPDTPPEMPFVYSGEVMELSLASMEVISDADFALTAADNLVVGQLVAEDDEPVWAQGWASAGSEDGVVNGAPIVAGSFAIYLPDGSYDVRTFLLPGSEWLSGGPQPLSVAGGETITLAVPVQPKDAIIVGALWDPRMQEIPTGIGGLVVADNPFTTVGTGINPGNGTFAMGVSAGLWNLGYRINPLSGYVGLRHNIVVPVESGQEIAVPLPITNRDSVLHGVVLGPEGGPVAGAAVTAQGLGDELGQVTLHTISREDGSFSLPAPHGLYRVWASAGHDLWLNPAQASVFAPPDGLSRLVILQFRLPDVELSGTVAISGSSDVTGTVHIWAYSDDGAATATVAPLGESYTLSLLSNSTWHVGAALETSSSFYAVRTLVEMGETNETLDLLLPGPHPKPGPVSVTFDPTVPQHLALADGTSIFIPAGAMPAEGLVTLHITPIATFPHQQQGQLFHYGYGFVALDAAGAPITAHFNQNVAITFGYSDEAVHELGLLEESLKPAYFSTTTESWTVPESYMVDTVANRVLMQIDHFTDYSLLGSTSGFTLYMPALSGGG